MRIVPGVKLAATFKSSVFVFGLDDLTGRSPASDSYFFTVDVGLAFDTATFGKFLKSTGILDKKKAPPPEAAPAQDDLGAQAPDPAREP